MSIRIPATFGGESFEVEISSDGTMSFTDPAIDYEIAFAAMGGDKMTALRLLDKWHEDPAHIILDSMGLSEDIHRLLVADWVEHVLYLFEQEYPGDNRPRKAVEASRDYAFGVISGIQLDRARRGAWAARDAAVVGRAPWAAIEAVRATGWVSVRAAGWVSGSVFSRAVGFVMEVAEDPDRERAWQIRHFVHAMEKLRAGRVWPRIEETS